MDKRSWPWRRKPSERPLSSTEVLESSPSSFPSARHLDYQDDTSISPDHSRVIDDETTQWQENEEKIKVLNDKLSAALLDAASKEVLAKQHAKLAEEAVSGWETVEAEAASLKQQLESTIQQKLATEDRVSHLDGALKECMRQLRNVREEQEDNIHNAIMKKTRDWDKKRCELEEKIADLEQKFFEKDAENRAMSRSLQERARSISEITDVCSKAQTEVSILQVRLESLEKEKAAFKYELNVAHKEIEIRNEEKGLSKRAADAASKQHMEDTKRIAKLEAECQRLRGLVRKKLPGPGAIALMKQEVEGSGDEKNDARKKFCKGVISSRDSSIQEITQENDHQSKEGGLWSERCSSLEEESKMLREILANRNNELQSARLMCARTASKLSAVEQQLETLKLDHGIQKMPVLSGLETLSKSTEPSLASVLEDGNDGAVSCAESWASALIAELDQFKKGKSIPGINKTMDASKTDLDDFMEMEQLASLCPCDKLDPRQQTFKDHEDGAATEQSIGMTGMITENSTLSEESMTKEAELHGVCELCKELTTKLAAAEEKFASNAADEASLISLRNKLSFLFEESADVAEVLEQIRADIGLPGPLPAKMRSLLCHGCCPDEIPDHQATRQHTMLAVADPSFIPDVLSRSSESHHTIHGAVAELTLAVCKVAQLLDDFISISTESQCTGPVNVMYILDPTDTNTESLGRNLQLPEDVQFRTYDLEAKCQKLVVVSNNFLNGKVELTQLMVELSSTLGHISRIKSAENNMSGSVTKKCFSCRRSIHTSGEMDFSGVGSPVSDTSKSECSEAAAKIVPADENTQNFGKDSFSSEVLRLEEELRMVVSEKIALETQMEADYKRFSEIEQDLLQLKAVQKDMEFTLKKDQEELQRLRAELYEAEQMVSNFQTQLASAESSKHLGEEQLMKMAALKEESDSQLHACKIELSNLHDQIKALAKEASNEQEKNLDLEAKCKELQNQLEVRSSLRCPQCAMAAGEDERMCRELEIATAAEKLAECERTILVLGHQLKALASPKGSLHEAIQSPLAQPDLYSSLRSHKSTGHDNSWEGGNSARFSEPRDFARHNAWEGTNSARFSEPRDFVSNKTCERIKKESTWDPRESIASDILDSELISLSLQGQTSGRKMFDMFGDKIPVHEDYIEAVAQMPSSPEADPVPVLPKRLTSKPPRRKKRSPRSFAGVDMSKSMNDASSPSAEKQHGSSFTRFFSRTKSTH